MGREEAVLFGRDRHDRHCRAGVYRSLHRSSGDIRTFDIADCDVTSLPASFESGSNFLAMAKERHGLDCGRRVRWCQWPR